MASRRGSHTRHMPIVAGSTYETLHLAMSDAFRAANHASQDRELDLQGWPKPAEKAGLGAPLLPSLRGDCRERDDGFDRSDREGHRPDLRMVRGLLPCEDAGSFRERIHEVETLPGHIFGMTSVVALVGLVLGDGSFLPLVDASVPLASGPLFRVLVCCVCRVSPTPLVYRLK